MKKVLVSFPSQNNTTVEVVCNLIEKNSDLSVYKKNHPNMYTMLASTFRDILQGKESIIIQSNGSWCVEGGNVKILREINDKKKEIEFNLLDLFMRMNMDKPSNFDTILEYVYEDVCESADEINWSVGDVVIGLRRWIERK
jgi:hypothetical protein